ncbi:MAG: carbohydrate kinase family protein [Acidobacteriaceae bacterium]|nr:carbohydrate kinase family protein [Acidobacteriaceae bacterium]
MPGRVIVCGNIVFDVLARPVEDPLHWGATTLIDSVSQQLGGNAGTTSFTLGKLGIPVSVFTLVGCDAAANALLERLSSQGVDLGMVHRTKAPTSTALCLINGKGERALLYQLGASAEDFPEPVSFPEEATHFHLAAVYRMRHLRKIAPSLLALAKERGLSTSVDTQWDTEGEWMKVLAPSLPYADYTLVNEDEARMLTGEREPGRAAERLRDRGANHVIIKLGARGCWADGEIIRGFEVSALDTTGAGDSFVGGFIAALYRGLAIAEAARFANAVGALSVQQLGATAGLLDWESTVRWIQSR